MFGIALSRDEVRGGCSMVASLTWRPPATSPLRACLEQLGAGSVRAPLLVLVGCPRAAADEELRGGRVVDRPEDVCRTFDREARLRAFFSSRLATMTR